MINIARNRGMTRNRIGSIAMRSNASTSSETLIVPNSAAIEDPLRAMTTPAINNGQTWAFPEAFFRVSLPVNATR
jgi:hypothetical protein